MVAVVAVTAYKVSCFSSEELTGQSITTLMIVESLMNLSVALGRNKNIHETQKIFHVYRKKRLDFNFSPM